MGTSLNGLTPAGTYPGLIKTGDNASIDGTLKTLSDGNGNNLPMSVSTTTINLTGTAQVGGVAIANTTQVAAKQDTLVSGTNIKTINGTSVLGSGNIVTPSTPPSGVAGAIQFSNGSAFASDAANLFWDDTNNRLGVGTNAPSVKYDQQGGGALFNMGGGGTNSFRVQRGGSTLLNVGTDNASIYLSADGGNNGNIQFTKLNGSLLMQISDIGTVATIKGVGTTSGTTSLLVQNSDGSNAFAITDDRVLNFYNQLQGPLLRASSNLACSSFQTQNYAALWMVVDDATNFGNVNFGTTTAVASARVQIDSTTKGFLPPRMTTTQKNAISSPAAGLQVYDTTLNQMSYYNGSSWVNI